MNYSAYWVACVCVCVCVLAVKAGMRDIMWRRKPNAGLLKKKAKVACSERKP